MDAVSDETVESELTNDGDKPRRIRVYARGGDFLLDLPPGCRCTFGYFNPAVASQKRDPFQGGYGGGGPGSETMKTTALRIYADTTDKRQLACFLGVGGFRDETIKLTKIVERVTIERRLTDDGEGTVEWGGKDRRELTAAPEAEFEAPL